MLSNICWENRDAKIVSCLFFSYLWLQLGDGNYQVRISDLNRYIILFVPILFTRQKAEIIRGILKVDYDLKAGKNS